MPPSRFPVLLVAASVFLYAQQPPARLNPTIQRIVDGVSEERIAASLRKLESFHTRSVISEQNNPTRGIGAAERWLAAEFKSYSPRLEVSTHEFEIKKGARVPADVKVRNVLAVLPGTVHKDRYVLVTAHYDTIAFAYKPAKSLEERIKDAVKDGMNEAEARKYMGLTPQDEIRGEPDLEKMAKPDWYAPGANDDGSGTAAVLELARVMSSYEFDKSIVFVAFAGEEVGLTGSTAYAKEARAKNMQIEAVLNNDIIGNETAGNGRTASSTLRVFSAGPEDGLPRAVALYAKELGERYVPSMEIDLVFRQDRFRRGGDHTPFANNGFGAVRFTTASEDYSHQHTDSDTVANMSIPYNTRVAKVNAAVAASLAMSPAPPSTNWHVQSGKNKGARRGLLSRGKSGYDAVLRWIPSPSPDVAGYSVLIRDTTSPTWQREIYVGDVNEYALKDVSIDDVILGVRAIDKDGNPSLIATYGLDGPASVPAADPGAAKPKPEAAKAKPAGSE